MFSFFLLPFCTPFLVPTLFDVWIHCYNSEFDCYITTTVKLTVITVNLTVISSVRVDCYTSKLDCVITVRLTVSELD